MKLNCKPGQLATIVRACMVNPCSRKVVGCPVRVGHVIEAHSIEVIVLEAIDGPIWKLDQALPCPSSTPGCKGLTHLADHSLRPFDPDSEPKDEDETVATPTPVAQPVRAE